MELNRFKQLLESTMGDVKPLINEQGQNIPLWRQVVSGVGDTKWTKIVEDVPGQYAGSAIIGDKNNKYIHIGKVGDGFGLSGVISTNKGTEDVEMWKKVEPILNQLDQSTNQGRTLNDFKFYPLKDKDAAIKVINELIPVLGF